MNIRHGNIRIQEKAIGESAIAQYLIAVSITRNLKKLVIYSFVIIISREQ